MKLYMRLKEKFHVGPSEQESASDPADQLMQLGVKYCDSTVCCMAGHFEQPHHVQQSQPAERMKDGKKKLEFCYE
jgi:hypothetical protein